MKSKRLYPRNLPDYSLASLRELVNSWAGVPFKNVPPDVRPILALWQHSQTDMYRAVQRADARHKEALRKLDAMKRMQAEIKQASDMLADDMAHVIYEVTDPELLPLLKATPAAYVPGREREKKSMRLEKSA